MSVTSVRALTLEDDTVARALVRSVYGGTRHVARVLELVSLALPGHDPECQGLVTIAGDGTVRAMLLYGIVGGAAGVIRIHALVGHTVDVFGDLLGAVRAVDSARAARMFLCELSDEAEDALTSAALTSAGFTREVAVADYFADGIALDVMVLRP